MTTLSTLECTACARHCEPLEATGLCPACGAPLVARYDLERLRQGWNREWISNGPSSMWRYAPVLPVDKPSSMVSLGEGMTPLVRARRSLAHLWIKDEGVNPAGSIQARGASAAVSMAVEHEISAVAIDETGAAAAVAAYAAAAGIEARVSLPPNASPNLAAECQILGAVLAAPAADALNLGAFREPYRIEGLKTVGYEIAEQMSWQAPDAVLCPVGTGTTLVALAKAFEELLALGWITDRVPRLFAAPAAGGPPAALGEPLIARAVASTGGRVVEVSAAEAVAAGLAFASREGVFAALEGAACLAALDKLLAAGDLPPEDRVVIVNTGSGLLDLDTYAKRLPPRAASQADKLGGLITPR